MKQLSNKISATLKKLRKKHGLSLDATSQKTGVSKAMLGQIERGESSPTISTLWKIATGFKVSFSSFLIESNREKTQKGKQIQMKSDKEMKVIPIFPFEAETSMEIFIIEIASKCSRTSLPHNTGVIEHIIVIKGEMEVLVGKSWHKLIKNEGLRFDASRVHGYRNLSSKKAIFHNIIHYL